MFGRSIIAVLLSGSAALSCGSPSPAPRQRTVDPLVVSEAYALKHHPTIAPRGLERAWHVEDHGDIWTVEMFKQGTVGGGIRMMVRKTDGQVIGAELTQ